MTLIKTSALSLIATIFKISYGLVVGKLLAVYGGAAGVALVGQFQNIQASLVGLAAAGFGQGLTKYLAEFKGDVKSSRSVFATAVKLVCMFLLPVTALLFVFSSDVSEFLFDSTEYGIWMKGLSVSLVPASLGAIFLAALNGLGEIRYLTIVGVLSSILGIGLMVVLVPLLGVSGVIIGLLSTPFLVLVLAAWYLYRSDFFSWAWVYGGLSQTDSKRLGKFVLMALAPAISIPVSHIIIRNYLGDFISLEAAGVWTAMLRVSEAYLLIITMTLSVYYLPKLSSLRDKKDLLQELMYGYKFLMPLVVVLAIGVFLLRDWIILLLFTDGFFAMRELFFWQLVGDVVKMGCFLMGFVLFAKGLVTIFIVTEVVVSILFVLLTYIFVDVYGLIGVTYAYVVVYGVNFLWLVAVMRNYFSVLNETDEVISR